MSEPTESAPPAIAPGDTGLVARLREETRTDHARVDAAFSRFDLSRRDGYAQFLAAQARVLPALERLLRPGDSLPGWRGRAALLLEDLAGLGRAAPDAAAPPIPTGEGARWGALYVMEGSRLGGTVLARRVPADFPRAFLGAVHPQGAWRQLLGRIDRSGLSQAEQAGAIAAAKSVFRAFEQAAHDQG